MMMIRSLASHVLRNVPHHLQPASSSIVHHQVRCITTSGLQRWSSSISKTATKEDNSSNKTPDNNRSSLKRELLQRIKIAGPLSVAEYMKFVLTHPVFGFYMNQDVFGAKGHFTTSPEISQVFGELIGVWLINEWQRVGSPKPFRIIELGPGRGTLSADISRVVSQFSSTRDTASLHLIEISSHLTQIQERTICGATSLIETDRRKEHHSLSKNGIPVTWYRSLEQLPEKSGFNAFVAHEFFDALPVHKFQRNEKGVWCEIMVDYDEKQELRFVLSKGSTPASKVLIREEIVKEMDHLEVCPDAGIITDKIVDRFNKSNTNGCFLVCDYGYEEESGCKIRDTFRGFKNHQSWDALKDPGSADLTADVDFSFLKRVVQKKGQCFRSYFLFLSIFFVSVHFQYH